MKSLFDFYLQVKDFNQKVGNKFHEYDTLDYWRAMESQSHLMVEESSEGVEAAKVNDAVESLDALCDEFFVWAWKAAMLEQSGFDIEGAIQAVCDNNATKYFDSYYLAVESKEMLEDKFDEEMFIDTSVVNGVPFYCVKKGNGKVMKPVGFKAVSLEQFVPKESY